MTDTHSQSFFGQSTGLIIQSSSKNEPYIFLRSIKRKPDSVWEKPSIGEGKTIRCSLDEMVMILRVLQRKVDSWSSYHTYKDNKTPISFSWENNKEDKLWINIGNYSKMLGIAQIEIFKLLLKHLIKEKIEFATTSSNTQKKDADQEDILFSSSSYSNNPDIDESLIVETSIINSNGKDNEIIEINGSIKAETEKAILIVFKSGQEVWFPKSTIHSQYKPDLGFNQTFLANKWIIEKNKVSI
ncbi:MAG: hypothetical protein ACFFHV_21790 [Promethearchaeota archaeon]